MHFAVLVTYKAKYSIGAADEARTRDPDLGKVVLYQLSYSRLSNFGAHNIAPISLIQPNLSEMVPRAGLEPARSCERGILNPLCLPIPPPGHYGGGSRSRTEVHGFAIRCIATLPTRHISLRCGSIP